MKKKKNNDSKINLIVIHDREDEDDSSLVDLLNQSYGHWGNLDLWKWKYERCANFKNNRILLAKAEGELAGVVTYCSRDINIAGNKVKTAILADGATHPYHRGKGIYAAFWREFLNQTRKDKTGLVFGFVERGRIPHRVIPRIINAHEIPLLSFTKIYRSSKVAQKKIEQFLIQNPMIMEIFSRYRITLVVKPRKESSRIVFLFKNQLKSVITNENLNGDINIDCDTQILLYLRYMIVANINPLSKVLFFAKNLLFKKIRVRFSVNGLRALFKLWGVL